MGARSRGVDAASSEEPDEGPGGREQLRRAVGLECGTGKGADPGTSGVRRTAVQVGETDM